MQEIKFSPLIEENKIQKRVQELGKQITKDYEGKDLVCICVLNGAFMFFSDLIREIDCDYKCDFLGLSSYQGTQSQGEVKIKLDLSRSIIDKDVLIVEDIVDTGTTIDSLLGLLQTKKPKSLSVATLLHKPQAQKNDIKPDYVGFEIGNDFVVGYGLDYNQKYRSLPYFALVQNIN